MRRSFSNWGEPQKNSKRNGLTLKRDLLKTRKLARVKKRSKWEKAAQMKKRMGSMATKVQRKGFRKGEHNLPSKGPKTNSSERFLKEKKGRA